MQKAKKKESFAKKFGFLIFAVAVAVLCFIIDMGRTVHGLELTVGGVVEMMGFLPPIFVLLGLFDVWVDRETVMRLMGRGSGFKGVALAFLLATLAAGPLYMAFPVAGVLLKKRAGLFQVFVFIGTWAIAKVPMLLFEASCFGFEYTLIRLVCNVAAIAGIAWIMTKVLDKKYTDELYRMADENWGEPAK